MTTDIRSTLAANTARGISAQLAYIVLMGGLIAISRRYFDLHIGLPGHTGILWMFLLVYGRGHMDRRATGLLMGVAAAF